MLNDQIAPNAVYYFIQVKFTFVHIQTAVILILFTIPVHNMQLQVLHLFLVGWGRLTFEELTYKCSVKMARFSASKLHQACYKLI